MAWVPADQSRKIDEKKNGLEEKFYEEEREQVWSVLKEIVLRISVQLSS